MVLVWTSLKAEKGMNSVTGMSASKTEGREGKDSHSIHRTMMKVKKERIGKQVEHCPSGHSLLRDPGLRETA